MVETQLNVITLVITIGVPAIIGGTLFVSRNLADLCKRVSRLEGRHYEKDRNS